MTAASRKWVLVVVLAACQRGTGRRTEVALAGVDTIVNADEERLGFAADLATDVQGTLYIADYLNGVVHVREAKGAWRTLGSKGSGPQEFLQPASLHVANNQIWVGDAGKGQVMRIGANREIVSMHRIAVGQPTSLNGNGGFVHASADPGTERLLLVGRGDSVLGFVADKLVPVAQFYDLTVMKRDAANNRVPAVVMNNVFGHVTEQGDVWAIYAAAGRVRHFGRDLRQVCDAPLTPPNITALHADFFERNRTEPDPARFFRLTLVNDVDAAGNRLYVLYNAPEGEANVLEILGNDCAVQARVTLTGVTGARAVVVTPDEAMLFLAVPKEGLILRAHLKGAAK